MLDSESLPPEAFTQTTINLGKARTVWVATIEVEISRLEGQRKIAIVSVCVELLRCRRY